MCLWKQTPHNKHQAELHSLCLCEYPSKQVVHLPERGGTATTIPLEPIMLKPSSEKPPPPLEISTKLHIRCSASISASKHLSKKKIQTETYLSSFPRCTWTTWPPMRRMRWKWGVPPGALEYPHRLCLYSWHQVSRGWEKTAPWRMVGDEGCVFATRYK